MPRGGPDGGDGGHGGDVVLVCDASRRDLGALRGSKHFRAGRGGHGEGGNRHGARGEDREIRSRRAPRRRRSTAAASTWSIRASARLSPAAAAAGMATAGSRPRPGRRRGSPSGGRGGEEGWIELRLKLLADAGLIGLPNAGKSSLLGRLTRAAPKVADYPFTTIEPVLGTIEDEDSQVILADIPGLIEGASEGAGLGHEFLAHVERCAMLVHLVDLAPLEGDPVANHAAVRSELASYGGGLELLPELIVLSKRDLLTDADVEAALADWRRRVGEAAVGVIAVSSVTGEGLGELRRRVLAELPDEQREPSDGEPAAAEFEVEHRVYRPVGEGGYSVVREGDGGFRVLGRGVELLFERHDLGNEEALAYLEQRLNEIGVIAALRDAGFEPGDDVRIGEHEFELHP